VVAFFLEGGVTHSCDPSSHAPRLPLSALTPATHLPHPVPAQGCLLPSATHNPSSPPCPGLSAGYKAFALEADALDPQDLYLLNSVGDLEDLNGLYSAAGRLTSRDPRRQGLPPLDGQMTDCSAFIKVRATRARCLAIAAEAQMSATRSCRSPYFRYLVTRCCMLRVTMFLG
jgi:hypothetical protein